MKKSTEVIIIGVVLFVISWLLGEGIKDNQWHFFLTVILGIMSVGITIAGLIMRYDNEK
jgi:hypothetical protein